LLGYSLVGGNYFPLGDSPSKPKELILEKVFGHRDPTIALQPYSQSLGYYFSESAGLFLYRGSAFSLGFTASWHSRAHKQNDDLSIVLYDITGLPVIVDGGYSGIINSFDQRSQEYHSTFMPVGLEWKVRDKKDNKTDFSCLKIDRHIGGRVKVKGMHSRVNGFVLTRSIEIDENSIFIYDSCEQKKLSRHRFIDSMYPAAKCRHRFIVPEDAEVRFQGESGCVVVRGFKISPSNNEKLEVSPIEIIYERKMRLDLSCYVGEKEK
jgi:hypothetical protein